MYTCPVCGYSELRHSPSDYTICPSCGTEFGYSDFATRHDELRRVWIAAGMQWHSGAVPRPLAWNPLAQLMRAGYRDEVYAFTGGYTQTETVQVGAIARPTSGIAIHNFQLSRASSAGNRVAGTATTSAA